MQSVSLFSSNNVKWQIPWRTLLHLYLQGIFFMLLRPKCLDLIFIKTEPRCLDRKYSPFQTKLIFWRVFTPKVRTGSRNDLCMGHIGQYFLEETWKSSFRLSYLPLTRHHHTHPALKEKCQQLELSPVLQTQPPSHWSQREIFHTLDWQSITRILLHLS